MNEQKKKRIKGAIISIVIVFVVYFAALKLFLSSGNDASMFCDEVEVGTLVTEVQARAVVRGMNTADFDAEEDRSAVLVVQSTQNAKALCRLYYENGRVTKAEYALNLY
ncbi:MAG: hypothetical protein GY850_21615 [bacterium]|nr:hypothetical protein [bacterium]